MNWRESGLRICVNAVFRRIDDEPLIVIDRLVGIFRKLHGNGPKQGAPHRLGKARSRVGRFDELSARLELVDAKLPVQFLIIPRCFWRVQAAAHFNGYKA